MTRASDRLRKAKAGEHLDLCPHGLRVCRKCAIVEDSGRRMSELISIMVASHPWDEIINSWMAIRLADGSSDNVLYESREAAIAHQPDERWCLYVFMRNCQGGIKPLDAQLMINLHRQVYDAGGRLSDPVAPSLIVSAKGYDKLIGRVSPNA
jgi:hypothetical protein